MENLFDAVCASLLYAPNRSKFVDGEGCELMNLMLREQKQSRESALKVFVNLFILFLKVLNYVTAGPEGKDSCLKFVKIYGLRTLFPLFMRTPSKGKRKETTKDEHEEHVCAVRSSLCTYTSDLEFAASVM